MACAHVSLNVGIQPPPKAVGLNELFDSFPGLRALINRHKILEGVF